MRMTLLAAALLAAASPTAGARAADGSAMAGRISVEGGFARATLPGAKTAGGYLTIVNHSGAPDRLVALASPAAATVSVHEMVMRGEVMTMRALQGALSVGGGETVRLAPGGLHLMFEGLKQPFVKGASVPLTLTFETAGPVELSLPVLAPNAKAPDAAAPEAMPGMDHPAN